MFGEYESGVFRRSIRQGSLTTKNPHRPIDKDGRPRASRPSTGTFTTRVSGFCLKRIAPLQNCMSLIPKGERGPESGSTNSCNGFIYKNMAERVGFEPTLEFPLNTLSKRAPSATRPSLRRESDGRNYLNTLWSRRSNKIGGRSAL